MLRRSLISVNGDRIAAFLMLPPSIILLAIFVYGFIGKTVYDSITDWEGVALVQKANFVGLENYEKLFTSLLGLLLAILIDQGVQGESTWRFVFLYAMALSFIVTGTVWRWLFKPVGRINRLPEVFGLEPPKSKWLTSRDQILQFNWQDLPMILSVAALVIRSKGSGR